MRMREKWELKQDHTHVTLYRRAELKHSFAKGTVTGSGSAFRERVRERLYVRQSDVFCLCGALFWSER